MRRFVRFFPLGAVQAPSIRSRKRRFALEQLEPRTVLSASASSTVAPVAVVDPSVGHASVVALDDEAPEPPARVDLRSGFNGFNAISYEQVFSDCVANAVAADIDYTLLTDGNAALLKNQNYRPSRLFLYYNARFFGEDRTADTPFSSVGNTTTGNTLRSAQNQGIASEGARISRFRANFDYPDTDDASRAARNPGALNYLAAPTVRVTHWTYLNRSTEAVKSALAAGKPVLFYMALPTNFPGSQSALRFIPPSTPGGLPTVPDPKNQVNRGGHIMLIVGYNDSAKSFIILNSWGKSWGRNGYAYLPYEYLDFKYKVASGAQYNRVGYFYTIDSMSVTRAPSPSIGKLPDLVRGAGADRAPGQINIDQTAAPDDGNASSFEFFSQGNFGRWVTPLLFSYDSNDQTYTLTGVGRSFRVRGSGRFGIPFDPVAGSSTALTTDSYFGFYNGDVLTSTEQGYPITRVVPNAGTISYRKSPGSDGWVSTGRVGKAQLVIGTKFSTEDVEDAVRLATPSADRVYSAMLNE